MYKEDEIDIARRVTQLCKHGGGFASVLCAVINDMRHRLPQDSLEGFTFRCFVIESAVQLLVCEIVNKGH